MTALDAVAAQLVDELGAVARAVGDVAGLDVAALVEARLDHRCAVLAAELCSDDDRLAAEAVLTVMCARWPDGADAPPGWWHTPVGRAVARSVGRDDTDAVTHSVAAAMLGVTRGTVAQLVHRPSGGLDRHPDGGVTRASVLARLARR